MSAQRPHGRTFFVEVLAEGACKEEDEISVRAREEGGAPFLEDVGVDERAVDWA